MCFLETDALMVWNSFCVGTLSVAPSTFGRRKLKNVCTALVKMRLLCFHGCSVGSRGERSPRQKIQDQSRSPLFWFIFIRMINLPICFLLFHLHSFSSLLWIALKHLPITCKGKTVLSGKRRGGGEDSNLPDICWGFSGCQY